LERFEFTLQDNGSGQKLQDAAWGTPHFSPSPGRAGERRRKELLGWVASSKPTYNALPNHFPQSISIGQGHTEPMSTPSVPQTFEHFEFKLTNSAWGAPHSAKNPSPERGEDNQWNCGVASHPLS
jgi:hypothetical protein